MATKNSNAITNDKDYSSVSYTLSTHSFSCLEEKGKTVVWHDRRNGGSSIDLDAPENVLMGVVINVLVKRFAGIWKSRHWITLRKIDWVWYNLDSDLSMLERFRDSEEVRKFLDFSIAHGGEVLLVMNQKLS
ncbi:ubiquitinyl hydrolase 1 [Trifolium repens]|nr:ubiquitinyl hydrolase 1 [Trifolium repens]